jgi:queuine tRNA-ribosyltransferase catalytic subunit
MVSLLHLADITEEGVTFQSPVDGSSMLLTPEHSMQIQNQLGADIIMALDDVVSSVNVDKDRFLEATHRTTRWIDRCIKAHARPEAQSLFAIVQVCVWAAMCSMILGCNFHKSGLTASD